MSNNVSDSESPQECDFLPSQNDASPLADIMFPFPELKCLACQQVMTDCIPCLCVSSQLIPSMLSVEGSRGTEFSADYPYLLPVETTQANMSLSTSLHSSPMHQLLPPEMMQPYVSLPYSVPTQLLQPPLVMQPSEGFEAPFSEIITSAPHSEPWHPIQAIATEQRQREQEMQVLLDVLWSPMCNPDLPKQCDPALPEQPQARSLVMIAGSKPERKLAAPVQSVKKRGRTAISLQEKVAIIDFVEKNKKHSTWKEMSETLKFNRATVQNIFNSRESVRKLMGQASEVDAPFTMETCRITLNAFHQMETLLIKWVIDMRQQQVPTSVEMIRWQAYAVHRLLSGLSHDPLPPHKFCPEWLRKFVKQHSLREGTPSDEVILRGASLDLEKLRRLLHRYAMDDIYFCDVTSIFALPPCVLSHPGRACQFLSERERTMSGCKRGPAISLLLFCNASGTVKREPVMLNRILETPKGLRRVAFADWLVKFNNEVEQDVLLLVSVAVWEQIKDKLQGLTKVRVEAVPAQLNGWLPMRAGIAREFKNYVNAINFEWTKSPDSLGRNVYQVYEVAMQEVQCSIIQQCFRRFIEAVEGLKPSQISKGWSPGQLRLKEALKKAHGAENKNNKGVYDYYLNQGSDIGPSAFLCAEMETIPTSSDVEKFLVDSGFGTPPVRVWWNYVLINQ